MAYLPGITVEYSPLDVTSLSLQSSTDPSEDYGTSELVWIIPTIVAVIIFLFLLAVGLFYCIRNLELFTLRRNLCVCWCCKRSEGEEYIHLNETFHIYCENYTLNESKQFGQPFIENTIVTLEQCGHDELQYISVYITKGSVVEEPLVLA